MSEAWKPEPIFAGKTVVIVAGGPSVTTAQIRLIGMARSRNLIRAIAVNDAVYLCWWADVVYACDAKWWTFHGDLPDFAGLRISIEAVASSRVRQIKNSGRDGFDPNPSSIRNGGNGGYQALHIGVHMGAARVILVGYDMRGGHWFGDHPQIMRGTPAPWEAWLKRFDALAQVLRSRGVAVVNASPGSALKCFQSVDLASELTSLER